MLMTIRLLAMAAVITLGASPVFAFAFHDIKDMTPDHLTVLKAHDSGGGYVFKCCTDDDFAHKFYFKDGMGEFFIDPLDGTWVVAGAVSNAVDYEFAMVFKDYDETTKTWSYGMGEAYYYGTTDLAHTIELMDVAYLMDGHRIWADVVIDGTHRGLLHFRVSAVPEPAAAMVFSLGLLVVRSATRRKAA